MLHWIYGSRWRSCSPCEEASSANPGNRIWDRFWLRETDSEPDLQVMGLAGETQFQRYRRVLNRAAWSSRLASQRWLVLLASTFTPDGVIVTSLNDTIKRRRGKQIEAQGPYRTKP